VKVYNAANVLVRTLVNNALRGSDPKGQYTETWDGKDDAGKVLPDGAYTYTITATNVASAAAAVTVRVPGSVVVDTTPPAVRLIDGSSPSAPLSFSPNGVATVRYQLSESAQVAVQIFDASKGLVRTLSVRANAGDNSFVWDGKNDKGTLLTDGVYTFTVVAADDAGNRSAAQSGALRIVTARRS
jgi:flagellar hook assembly protein FlgD